MIEILQFLFATEKDQQLYLNQDGLIKELIDDYNFTEEEIKQALDWLSPIANEQRFLSISPDAFRRFSDWEEQHLPKNIVKQILSLEQSKKINLVEREILFDRLGELCLDWKISDDDAQEILDGLVAHLKNHKQNFVGFELHDGKFLWAGNASVH